MALQEPIFDPMNVPTLSPGIQYGLVQLNEPKHPEEVDTQLSNVFAFMEQNERLKQQLAQAPPDYWAQFLKGANEYDWSEPGKSDLEQLAYQGGEFSRGLSAEPLGVVIGGGAGSVFPGVGTAAGAAVGGELSNQSVNNILGRRAEYLRQKAAGEKLDEGKQEAAGTIQQVSSIIPFSDDVRRGAGLLGKAGIVALNALKQGGASAAASAATDLATTGKVDADKAVSSAIIGGSTNIGGDAVILSGGKLAKAGESAAKWLTKNEAPKGPGFGAYGYLNLSNYHLEGEDLGSKKPNESALSDVVLDGSEVMHHSTKSLEDVHSITVEGFSPQYPETRSIGGDTVYFTPNGERTWNHGYPETHPYQVEANLPKGTKLLRVDVGKGGVTELAHKLGFRNAEELKEAWWQGYSDRGDLADIHALNKKLMDMGYDGLVLVPGGTGKTSEVVYFKPHLAKVVGDNAGTYGEGKLGSGSYRPFHATQLDRNPALLENLMYDVFGEMSDPSKEEARHRATFLVEEHGFRNAVTMVKELEGQLANFKGFDEGAKTFLGQMVAHLRHIAPRYTKDVKGARKYLSTPPKALSTAIVKRQAGDIVHQPHVYGEIVDDAPVQPNPPRGLIPGNAPSGQPALSSGIAPPSRMLPGGVPPGGGGTPPAGPPSGNSPQGFNDFLAPFRKNYDKESPVRPPASFQDVNGDYHRNWADQEDRQWGQWLNHNARSTAEYLVDKDGINATMARLRVYLNTLPPDADKRVVQFAENVAHQVFSLGVSRNADPVLLNQMHVPARNKQTVYGQGLAIWKQAVLDNDSADTAIANTFGNFMSDEQAGHFAGLYREAANGADPKSAAKARQQLEKDTKELLENVGVARKFRNPASIIRELDALGRKGIPVDSNLVRTVTMQQVANMAWPDKDRQVLRALYDQYNRATNVAQRAALQSRIAVEISKRRYFSIPKFLLTNAKTVILAKLNIHTANAIAQGLHTTGQVLTDVTRLAVDMAHSKITGQPRQHISHVPFTPFSPEVEREIRKRLPTVQEEVGNIFQDLRYGGDSRTVGGNNDFRVNDVITNSKYLGSPYRLNNAIAGLIDRPLALWRTTERYGQRLQGMIDAKVPLTPEALDRAFELSVLEGQQLVFQNKNRVTEGYQDIKSGMAKRISAIIPGKPGRTLGQLVADANVPFAQTMGSIGERVFMDTPGGFLNALRKVRGNDEATKQRMVDSLASGLTGTAATMAFLAAAEGGAIQVEADPLSLDRKQIKADESQGVVRGSINLSAFTRAWLSGQPFNPKAYAMQPGDELYKLGQYSPAKQKMYFAALIANGKYDANTLWKMSNTLFADETQSGVVPNLRRAADYRDPETGESNFGAALATQSANYAVNAVSAPWLPNVADALDPTPPDIQGADLWQQPIRTWMANFPGLRNMIPNQLNEWGDEKRKGREWYEPTRHSKVKGPQDNPGRFLAHRLFKETGYRTWPEPFSRTGFVLDEYNQKIPDPERPRKYLTYQVSEEQRRAGTVFQGQMFDMMSNVAARTPQFQQFSPDTQGWLMQRVLADVKAATRIAVFGHNAKFVTNSGGQGNPRDAALLENPERYWRDRLNEGKARDKEFGANQKAAHKAAVLNTQRTQRKLPPPPIMPR